MDDVGIVGVVGAYVIGFLLVRMWSCGRAVTQERFGPGFGRGDGCYGRDGPLTV